MPKNTILYLKESSQSNRANSFVGGIPKLPIDLMLQNCQLCGSQQTFFFQLAFEGGHTWCGKTLAVFACTSCADQGHLIPEMLSVQLAKADIPEGFLRAYQKNFQICVFETELGELRDSYQPVIEYREVVSGKSRGLLIFGEYGSPVWQMEDEAPSSYVGQSMHFLFQLKMDLEFPTVKGAPPQKSPFENEFRGVKERSHYDLFVANELYFFGTPEAPFDVYVLPQCD